MKNQRYSYIVNEFEIYHVYIMQSAYVTLCINETKSGYIICDMFRIAILK